MAELDPRTGPDGEHVEVEDYHRRAARIAVAMGHGDPPLEERVAQAIADAEARGARLGYEDGHRDGEHDGPLAAFQPAELGDIFGTPDGQVVRVKRVGRTGIVTVVVVGGPRDGEEQRMSGIPDVWSRYPR